jgi:PilZ domain
MSERRVSNRQASLVFYDLAFAHSGERFGDLIDLSGEGMLALCDVPLLPGSRVALQMDIAARMLGTRSLGFEAECRWCQPSACGGGYACGLQLLPGGEAATRQIPHLAATMIYDSMRAF